MLKRFSKFNIDLLKYGVAAIIIAVPLYPKFPLLAVPGTHVSVRLEDLLLFFVAVVWFFTILPNLRNFAKNKINYAILLFLTIGLLSVASGVFLTQTAQLHLGILHWARRVEYLLCFFIGMAVMKGNSREKNLAFFIKCLLMVVVLAFIYGFGQKKFSWPVITTQNNVYAKGVALRYMPGGHLVSTFAGHYDLATFLVLIFPLLYILLFSSDKILEKLNIFRKIIFTRLVLLATCFGGLWMLVYSASRISIVSYFGSVTLGLIFAKRIKYIPLVIFASLIFISFSSNLLDRYMNIIEVYAQEEVVEDRSTSIRLNVEWPRAIRAFTKNPILGTGFSSITLATDNDYLRLLGEVGILGFSAFILIFYKIGLLILKNYKILWEESFSAVFIKAVVVGIPGVFLNAVFIDIFESSKFAIIFWLFLGITVSLLFNNYENKSSKNIT